MNQCDRCKRITDVTCVQLYPTETTLCDECIDEIESYHD